MMRPRNEALTFGGGGPPPGGPDCLAPEVALSFVRGRLSDDDFARAEVHVDGCPACRHYVSELAATSAAYAAEPALTSAAYDPGGHSIDPVASTVLDPAAGSDAAGGEDGAGHVLARGATLERYVIDGLLGSGGMGVVYSAYDPKLDRKVALKMVHTASAGRHEARDRLLREARAMARLSHPNVVAVYDVGVHEGQLFLAMEFVDGVTLRQWLRRAPRAPREVLRAFVQAGQGLGAAHAVGVVHRDFKPDNVLVDKRGRVCVTDFGLARAALDPGDLAPASAPRSSRRGPAAGPLGASMTRTGALLGTPAYMAPEQHLGRAADAKSDQFSFCVALYEALYGRAPFAGSTWHELAESVTAGALRDPPARAGVPPRAYRALARGLSVDPSKRFAAMAELLGALADEPAVRRRRALAAAGAALTLGALALGTRRPAPAARPTCQGAERRVEAVWGAAQKGAVRDALLRTGKPFAPDTWRGVERALDGYARDWAAARVDACEATHVRGEQSAELLDLRMACLDERLKGVGALVEVLAGADASVAGNAVGAALALSPLAPCADREALLARAKPPADPAAAARLEALRDRLARSKAQNDAGKYREALALAAEVAGAAGALGERALEAEALLEQGLLEGLLGSVKEGEATLGRAVAQADVAGDDDTRARASFALLFNVGVLQLKPALVPVLNEQAKSAIGRLGGDPGLDGLRAGNYAIALLLQGKRDEALGEFRAALPLLEKGFGPESRQVQTLLNGLGHAQADGGDLDAALATLGRAVGLAEAMLGPRHPEVAALLHNVGQALAEQTRFDEAQAVVDRVLAIEEDALGPDSPNLWLYLDSSSEVLLERGQYRRALPLAERAVALCERLGEDHEDLVYPLSGLARVRLALGEPRRAVPLLERALRLPTYPEAAPALAEARFALARALWASGGDRRRARRLATAARDAYRESAKSPLERQHLRAVEQWLARPGR